MLLPGCSVAKARLSRVLVKYSGTCGARAANVIKLRVRIGSLD
jgi:hypothetical protein